MKALMLTGPIRCPRWTDHAFSGMNADGWRICATCGMWVNDDLYVFNKRLT